MKEYKGWEGTAEDVDYILNAICNADSPSLRSQFSDLTDKEFTSLLCAALASNLVVEELAGQMAWIYENDPPADTIPE